MHPVLVLTWGWVHELVWVVAEQSILDVATAHTTGPWKERDGHWSWAHSSLEGDAGAPLQHWV